VKTTFPVNVVKRIQTMEGTTTSERGELKLSNVGIQAVVLGATLQSTTPLFDCSVHIDFVTESEISLTLSVALDYPQRPLGQLLDDIRDELGPIISAHLGRRVQRLDIVLMSFTAPQPSGHNNAKPSSPTSDKAISLGVRLLSAILAMAMLSGALLVLFEVPAGWVGNDPLVLPNDFATRLRSLGWRDGPVLSVIAGTILVGLAALVGGLMSRSSVTLQTEVGEDLHLEKAALTQTLSRQLEQIAGVTSVTVRATKTVVSAAARCDAALHREDAHAVVSERLAAALKKYSLPLTGIVRLTERKK
jgi:hypothetical protein